MFTELFIIKTKLIHKVGGHLLNLVIRERLNGKKKIPTYPVSCKELKVGSCWLFICRFLPVE